MKTLIISICAIFVIIVKSATVLDESIYKADSLLYTAKHDIVDIYSSSVNTDILFIVEKLNGTFKGLYALETAEKDDSLISTKVLDNGKCTTSDNVTVYFGASDGIYTYNFAEKKAEKYGNITADIKAIQKDSNTDVIYIISDDQLSRVTEKGTKMKKVESVSDVQDFVLDKDNNVYLYEKRDSRTKNFEDKYSKPKVIVRDKVIDVKGLPDNYSQFKLTRSYASSAGVLFVLDNKIYRIFPNGTSLDTEYIFENAPTAYYIDLGIIQLFSRGRKLYQFNIIELVLTGVTSAIGSFYSSFIL